MKRMKFGWILRLVVLLFFVSLASFLLVENSPIDPVNAYITAGDVVSAEQRQEIIERFGLNNPPLQRYLDWLQGVFRLDLGESIIYRQPVINVIIEKFSTSMLLMITAWIFSGVIGFGLGILMGVHEKNIFGKVLKSICLTLASVPTFLLGIFFLIIFSVTLNIFPIGFSVPVGVLEENVTIWQRLHHLILPALTLSFASFSTIALHTREKMISVLQSDYVLFAKTRGMSKKQIVLKHGIRNIMLPFVTLQFTSLSEIFGGSILAETVFSYPGLGKTVVDSGLKGDIHLLLGIALFSAIFVFCGNLTANIIYRFINPKIRLGNADE